MNWFERYGIPGAYFLALVVAWVIVFTWQDAESFFFRSTHAYLTDDRALQSLVTGLIGLGALTFLPLGYVITVLSQVLYYLVDGVHRKAVARLRAQGMPLANAPNSELLLEPFALELTTFSDRMPLEKNKFVRDWISRRQDVVAISSSIIVATIVATLVPLYLWITATTHDAMKLAALSVAATTFTLPILALFMGVMYGQDNGRLVGLRVLLATFSSTLFAPLCFLVLLGRQPSGAWAILVASNAVVAVMFCSVRLLRNQVVDAVQRVFRRAVW